MKKYLGVFLLALTGAGLGTGGALYFLQEKEYYVPRKEPITLTKTTSTGNTNVEAPDFIGSSSLATPAVVHIKSYMESTFNNSPQSIDPFRHFFGDNFGQKIPERQASGSGVIIEENGYIITNNHVVEGATKIQVVLNDKRTYEAELIGTDPTTDIAVLKIDESQLPVIGFGNSDNVQVGEWVLAVGNPFNLTSTVTAGIVSAKGRSLNILDEEYRIESFIQTDAAVNPGNSGGALINTIGELVGINTAIASHTGSFSGYSFAIPSNLVKKVMNDLIEFGKVQRGIIGVQIRDITSEMAEELDLPVLNGALISGIFKDGAADEAGIEEGDIITQINDSEVRSSAELQEIVGRFRPGEKVQVRIIRDEKEKIFTVELKNMEGTTALLKRDPSAETIEVFGCEVGGLSEEEKQSLGIDYGVMLYTVGEGILGEIGLDKGYIITKVNKEKVYSPKDLEKQLKSSGSRVSIEATDQNGTMMFFNFSR